MARRNGTDGSLLASLPWTVAALSFAVLPHLPYLPAWITLTYVVCAGMRLQIERKRWHLPAAWVRLGLATLCFVGVLVSYDYAISGVGPGSALLAVMAALKLLETRKRRDQFVLLFISIFLIMSSLLREQFLWSLPYLLLGLVLIMTAWLQMSASRSSSTRQAFRDSLRLMLYAAPLMLAMWILFPRISTPFWSVPIDTSGGVTGLSDTVSPGDISSLSLSNAVAFRVRFDDAVPAPRQRYWRGLVLRHFNGRSWTSRQPTVGERSSWAIEYLGDPVSYEITMEPTRQQWVFALDLAYEWTLEQTFMGQQQQLARAQPIDQRIVYRAVSYPSFILNPELDRFTKARYTDLPPDSNPRTLRLAEELRSAAADDREYIDMILRKFNQEAYFYTLEPPALDRNSVDEFIFESRRGFCEHYASAFAVLMRGAGIPARVVIGYQGGELNPMGNYLIVRQSDAHAWTEVWLDDGGWTRVDPTSAVAPERIDAGMSGAMFDGTGAIWGLSTPSLLLHRLTLTWDVLNAQWNEWVLAYGPDNQMSLMRWLGMEEPNFRRMLLTLIAVVAAMLAIIAVVLTLRYRPPARDKAAVLYGRFVRKTGLEAEQGEPPLAYASRLSARTDNPSIHAAVADVTDKYLRVRYGKGEQGELEDLRLAVMRFTANDNR